MDLNIRLIDAVRQCPLLYKSNASLAERQCGWRQISQQMKMQEAILKSRWHFLREHFLRNAGSSNANLSNAQFPYKKEMEFLLPYLRQPQNETPQQEEEFLPANIIKPEFVITEKDLENDSGNEEYVFLEVEALGSEEENNAGQSTSDCEQQQIYETSENAHNEEAVVLDFDKENTHENKPTKSPESEKCADITTEDACHNTIVKDIVKNENKEEALENVNERVEAKQPANKPNHSSSTQNTGERCEDAIFGELVTAMLKRMPAEKKLEIKRHIMNLLLT